MGKIIEFPRVPCEPGLHRIVAEIAWQARATPGLDPLGAKLLEEEIYVAGSYTHSYLEHLGFCPELAEYADVARLSPDAIAEHIASDLQPESRAGIARTANHLIMRTRMIVDAPAAA